jgi:flavin-dependent dehydrogenase
VGRMAELCTWAGEEAKRHGVQIMLGTAYQGRDGAAYRLQGPHGAVRVLPHLVVGADGARSRVARDLGLDTNRSLIVGAEETYPVQDPTDPPPTFHCTLDPRIAPGYLAWVVHDGAHVHVGTAGYPSQFRHGLRRSLASFRDRAPGLSTAIRTGPVEHRAGPIPVGGLLRRIGNRDGLLVGDAAGAVSPLTAGGLDPCLRLSDHAAEILDAALTTGRREALHRYDAAPLRRRLGGRMALRAVLARTSSPHLVEAAFAGLRTAPGRAAARHVLFSDKSFPLGGPSV